LAMWGRGFENMGSRARVVMAFSSFPGDLPSVPR